MYLRILKKDLKRKKTMNIILLMFIILASTFMAVSANNILTVISGTDYYLDKAGIGDYIAVTQGENGNIDNILENCGVDYSCENVTYSDKGNVKVNGGKFASGRNSMITGDTIFKLSINYCQSNKQTGVI